MLQQNFKTAKELKLTDKQHKALVLTLVALETGRLTHVTEIGDNRSRKNSTPAQDEDWFTGHFNMATWCHFQECGTVCCIGGTAELLGDLECYELEDVAGLNAQGALADLLYPTKILMPTITTAQAAIALRNYLTFGEARWTEAIA